MSIPPVVSDPEGPCPERRQPSEFWLLPHDFQIPLGLADDCWTVATEDFERLAYRECRHCGGRKPDA